MLVVSTHRYRSLVLRAELRRELVVRAGGVDRSVTHLAVPQYLGGFRDDLHVVERVLMVEAEYGHEATVKDPEVLGREVRPLGVLPPQVPHVLARGHVAPRIAEQEQLPLGRR